MSNKRKAPWENRERHYCSFCNAWMGSDRQSILLHENGKKHKQNVEKHMAEKREEKKKADQNAQFLQSSLQQMEAAARQSLASDLSHFAEATMHQHLVPTTSAPPFAGVTISRQPPIAVPAAVPPPPPPAAPLAKEERKQWESRKKDRDEQKRKKKEDGEPSTDTFSSNKPEQRIHIELGQGTYTHGEQTFLEGVLYGDILEEDMPIQLWVGPVLANDAEKRLLERHHLWKDGVIAAVRRRPSKGHAERLLVDVAYLQSPDADEETLEKSVPLDRIRILIGADESIPKTIEEARLLAMGGEEIQVDTGETAVIDETTGLGGWSTVAIKRTTVSQELKEERARLRQKRQEALQEEERQKKLAEERRMEEAKVANADDSALGAFDVWNRTSEGYKGVDIHKEAKVEIEDFAKKLSDGKKNVGFKKAKKKTQNRRTTSLDD